MKSRHSALPNDIGVLPPANSFPKTFQKLYNNNYIINSIVPIRNFRHTNEKAQPRSLGMRGAVHEVNCGEKGKETSAFE
jgi:hypothetical protein